MGRACGKGRSKFFGVGDASNVLGMEAAAWLGSRFGCRRFPAAQQNAQRSKREREYGVLLAKKSNPIQRMQRRGARRARGGPALQRCNTHGGTR